MTVEANREIALECLSRMNSTAFLDLLADDATYTVIGPTDFALSGTRTKRELAAAAPEFYRLMAVAPKLSAVGVTAEGERVAVEAESNGELANGREYRNRYHFLFVVAGGKVKRITEYVDTLYAQRLLFE